MMEKQQDIAMLEALLAVQLPLSYRSFLEDESRVGSSAILGLPLTLDQDSAWGATEFLRALRPDLEPLLVVIRITDTGIWCLDLRQGGRDDAPVVEVSLEDLELPRRLFHSLEACLEDIGQGRIIGPGAPPWVLSAEEDLWFVHGLERLDWHMTHLPFRYDHQQGGQLPRSHLYRPYRFCVQDIILGNTVIRHDRKYNRLEVDVFLTAAIPEYEPNSGCRALALILLGDAYKGGGSMEIKFTQEVEGGRVPRELCRLAESLGVHFNRADEGGITPREAKELFLALSDFRPPFREKIMKLEQEGRLSAPSVCFAMHHGVWTAAELEVILFGGHAPDSILKGGFPPEMWHLFHDNLFQARNAVMAGYLDREMRRREHTLPAEPEAVLELEDDERQVEISFDPSWYTRVFQLDPEEKPLDVPWQEQSREDMILGPGRMLHVLLRAREAYELAGHLSQDLKQAAALKSELGGPTNLVCILMPGDFRRLKEAEHLTKQAAAAGVGLIICPAFLNQLDQEVNRRFEAVRLMRQ